MDLVESPKGGAHPSDRAASLRPQPPTASSLSSIPCATTPGPWSIRWTCSGASIYAQDGRRVAYTAAPAKGMGREEVAANAALIAAAPELYTEQAVKAAFSAGGVAKLLGEDSRAAWEEFRRCLPAIAREVAKPLRP